MIGWLRRMLRGNTERTERTEREDLVQRRYHASLRKAVRTLPGDKRLAKLMREAEDAVRGHKA